MDWLLIKYSNSAFPSIDNSKKGLNRETEESSLSIFCKNAVDDL